MDTNVLINDIDNASNENVISDLSKNTNIKYSDEQLDILRHIGGMCIQACPGSGKTTVLTHLILKRIVTGEIADQSKLMCTTFSNAGASEMNTRLQVLSKKANIRAKVEVKTMHAFYLNILRYMGYTNKIIKSFERKKWILEACADCGYKPKERDTEEIESLLGYQINKLMSDNDLFKSPKFNLMDIRTDEYTAIRVGYNKRKSENCVFDFDDLQLIVYGLLKNENTRGSVVDYCSSKYTDFYIDEAQDTSKIQFEILKYLVKSKDNIVIIGDNDQCVYAWRGADPSVMLDACVYYGLDRLSLSTNYRCKSVIVKDAVKTIRHNYVSYDKKMLPFEDGGKIKICGINGSNSYELSKSAYKYITDLVDSGVDKSDIAVLCRNNSHIVLLNNMLFRHGVLCETSSETMRFSNNPIFKDLSSLYSLLDDNTNSKLTSTMLYKICPYLTSAKSYSIGKFQELGSWLLSDVIGYLLKYTLNRNIDYIKPDYMKLSNKLVLNLQSGLSDLPIVAVDSLEDLYYAITSVDKTSGLLKVFKLYISSTDFWYKTNESRRNAYGIFQYFLEMINTLGYDQTKMLLDSTSRYETSGMSGFGSLVNISTMHNAKGKEWKYVVLFADDNITFPNFENISTLCHNGFDDSDISLDIAGERRLHYVAMTRAKDELIIISNKRNLSLFAMEAVGLLNTQNNDQEIITMANNGKISNELLIESDKEIFSSNSEYYINIDTTNVNCGTI